MGVSRQTSDRYREIPPGAVRTIKGAFRPTKTVQPLVGLGTEVHLFMVAGHVFRQWGVVYLEAGSGFAVTQRVSLGAIATVDWATIGEPGPGLAARLFVGYRF